MCYAVCGMVHIKELLLLIGKSSPCGGSGFPSHYLSGPLPYVRCHITVNNKTFPSIFSGGEQTELSLKDEQLYAKYIFLFSISVHVNNVVLVVPVISFHF